IPLPCSIAESGYRLLSISRNVPVGLATALRCAISRSSHSQPSDDPSSPALSLASALVEAAGSLPILHRSVHIVLYSSLQFTASPTLHTRPSIKCLSTGNFAALHVECCTAAQFGQVSHFL